ncbi:MAG: 2-amino-4-hydroxy-6-hydroxymethyldihydropteridine diphosphokinase [Desulfobacterales bacterium]
MPIAYLSVGSNLGDKLLNCRQALEALAEGGAVRIQARSRVYRTEPVDYAEQEWFINQVVRVETELAPLALLDWLQEVQRRLGRSEPAVRFGPRVIDLDILLYDRLVLQGPRLSLPHPRMQRRRFVLQPLCDICPDLIHPVLGRGVRALLAELGTDGQEVVEYRCCG